MSKFKILTSVLLIVSMGCTCTSPRAELLVGRLSDAAVDDKAVIAAAKFAVEAQEKTMASNKIALIEIARAREQVVAGTNYYLDLRVDVDGNRRRVEVLALKRLNGKHELTS